jgi:hypothetical protein
MDPAADAQRVPGLLDLVVTLVELPTDVRTVRDGWKQFETDCDGWTVQVRIKPRALEQMAEAAASGEWHAIITGQLAAVHARLIVMRDAAVHVRRLPLKR